MQSVALLDDLLVQERPVLQPDVCQGAAVAVDLVSPRVGLDSDPLALGQPSREFAGFLAEALDGLLGVDGLRGVDAEESDALATIEDQGVTVNDAGDFAPGAWFTRRACWDQQEE